MVLFSYIVYQFMNIISIKKNKNTLDLNQIFVLYKKSTDLVDYHEFTGMDVFKSSMTYH